MGLITILPPKEIFANGLSDVLGVPYEFDIEYSITAEIKWDINITHKDSHIILGEPKIEYINLTGHLQVDCNYLEQEEIMLLISKGFSPIGKRELPTMKFKYEVDSDDWYDKVLRPKNIEINYEMGEIVINF
jgi:hypothetical protein